MSLLTDDEASRIARLARLALTEEELRLFARQLADILTYVEELGEVDTRDVPATSHPLQVPAPLREDEVRPPLPRDEALRAAPDGDVRAGLFKVPRVIGS